MSTSEENPLLGVAIAGYLPVEAVGGSGGAGRIYKAKETDTGDIVAIKEYDPVIGERSMSGRLAPQPGFETEYDFGLRMFRREAEVLAGLDEAALVPVRDIIEANGTCYYIMPWLGGETLMHRLEAPGQPAEDEVFAILLPILSSLAALHGAGMIHANLAPHHIALLDNRPLLIGHSMTNLALRRRTAASVTRRIQRVPYMPVELFGDSEPGDPASDIYSLAAVFAHWLTGEEPMAATLRARDASAPPLMQRLRYAYSERLLRFLDAGLQPHIDDRPPSVEDWGQLLLVY